MSAPIVNAYVVQDDDSDDDDGEEEDFEDEYIMRVALGRGVRVEYCRHICSTNYAAARA